MLFFLHELFPLIQFNQTEITWNGSYVPGQMYYAVVEACNNAGLCSKKSSNGILLDNSPPIHGLVSVGSGRQHDKYIPRR